MAELIYPKLSYTIVGILFKVSNELGYGHREIAYQKATEELLYENKIKFQPQIKSAIKFNNRPIVNYFLDFLIDDKIILEIKSKERFNKEDVAQVYDYLKAKNLRLGILAAFTKTGVKFKRIIHRSTLITNKANNE